MTGQRTGALARLREIRDELGADDAPRRVNLRDYAAPGSAAWDAFVEASGQPGHNVRLNTERGYLTTRIFNTNRIFNSAGIVELIIRLYTQGTRQKPRAVQNTSAGGLLHLIRVLDQLERTHDVYGMEPEALLRVLPSEFRAWDGGPGPQR